MAEFDRTESSYIENKIEQEKSALELGRVVKVWEHTQADDDSNHEVNIILRDEDKERRRVPILNNTPGSIQPPENGDLVVVGFLDGSGEAPVVMGQLYNAQQRSILGSENIYRLKRGDLYLEAHPDGDWMRIVHKDSDDGSTNAELEVKQDGTIDIQASRVFISDSEQLVQLTQSSALANGGANEHNLNAPSWAVVPWDAVDEYNDVAYTFDGTEAITIEEDGHYEVYSNLYYSTPDTTNRMNIDMRFTKNGSPLPGRSSDGFVSGQSNNNTASTDFTKRFQFSQGDVIRVETQQEAQTGNLYPVANQSTFSLKKLNR